MDVSCETVPDGEFLDATELSMPKCAGFTQGELVLRPVW